MLQDLIALTGGGAMLGYGLRVLDKTSNPKQVMKLVGEDLLKAGKYVAKPIATAGVEVVKSLPSGAFKYGDESLIGTAETGRWTKRGSKVADLVSVPKLWHIGSLAGLGLDIAQESLVKRSDEVTETNPFAGDGAFGNPLFSSSEIVTGLSSFGATAASNSKIFGKFIVDTSPKNWAKYSKNLFKVAGPQAVANVGSLAVTKGLTELGVIDTGALDLHEASWEVGKSTGKALIDKFEPTKQAHDVQSALLGSAIDKADKEDYALGTWDPRAWVNPSTGVATSVNPINVANLIGAYTLGNIGMALKGEG